MLHYKGTDCNWPCVTVTCFFPNNKCLRWMLARERDVQSHTLLCPSSTRSLQIPPAWSRAGAPKGCLPCLLGLVFEISAFNASAYAKWAKCVQQVPLIEPCQAITMRSYNVLCSSDSHIQASFQSVPMLLLTINASARAYGNTSIKVNQNSQTLTSSPSRMIWMMISLPCLGSFGSNIVAVQFQFGQHRVASQCRSQSLRSKTKTLHRKESTKATGRSAYVSYRIAMNQHAIVVLYLCCLCIVLRYEIWSDIDLKQIWTSPCHDTWATRGVRVTTHGGSQTQPGPFLSASPGFPIPFW